MDLGILGHGGTKMVQLFCGCQSLLTAVCPIWREGNISGAREAFICQYGAPYSLFRDNAKSQIGKAVRDIYECMLSRSFNVNHTISIRILQNAAYRKLKSLVTLF
jgi:hypothetical protein